MIKKILKYQTTNKENINLKYYQFILENKNQLFLIYYELGDKKILLYTMRFNIKKYSKNTFELGNGIFLSDYDFKCDDLNLYEIMFSDLKKEIINLLTKAQKMIKDCNKNGIKNNTKINCASDLIKEVHKEFKKLESD